MNKVDVKLIEFESMLHASVQSVGRTITNLQQEMGGFGSKTPGSGDPGGGKGGRPTVYIADPSDPVTHRQLEHDRFEGEGKRRRLVERGREIVTSTVDDGSFAVPVTPVEVQALGFAGGDIAARKLDELRRSSIDMVHGLGAACTSAGVVAGPFDSAVGTARMVALGYARLRRLQRSNPPDVDGAVLGWLKIIDPDVATVFRICQNWGYIPGKPAVPKARSELLAVDLTEQWCTSHLRVGERRHREPGRDELCQWCYKFRAAEGFLPPVELVRIHVEQRRVYDHQVAPFRQAHRDRMRNMVKR